MFKLNFCIWFRRTLPLRIENFNNRQEYFITHYNVSSLCPIIRVLNNNCLFSHKRIDSALESFQLNEVQIGDILTILLTFYYY